MNNYILKIGAKLPDFRRLLDWTQEDLAKNLGISRATIVSIEKEPTKLTKSITLALFLVVTDEILRRTDNFKNIDFAEWNNGNKEEFINQVKKVVGVNSSVIKSLAATSASAIVIPILGALLNLFAKPSQANENTNVTSDNLKISIKEAVYKMRASAEQLFEVNSLDIKEFMELVRNEPQYEEEYDDE